MHCWLEYAWAVFEAARQVEFEGIEIVQAMCTVLLARRKGLHITDAANSGTDKESSEQLELEMRRRVWWYIAATDWNMAASDGPGEGAYSIHPHQQAVEMPHNINDDNLDMQSREFERPSTELTSVSCFLIRLRVSEVCRDIVDLQWASRLSGLAQYSNHHRVHLIDKKILGIIRNLSPELGLDQGDTPELQQQPVTVHVQRLLLNSMIYARRCKLHLPFLFNTQQDTRSAPLRLICLSAARKVVDIFSEMWHQGSKLDIGHKLHCGCLDFLYFATVVLLADFCLNVSDEERHTLMGKIEAAVKVLQRARVESSMVEIYLASLSTIARRHNIHLPQPIKSQPLAPQDLLIQQATLVPEFVSQMLPPTGSSVDNGSAMLYETNNDSSQFLSYFRGLDDMDWDVLLSDIDNFIH
ncbi:unnamed protein product [Clonostachys byssicola]|uniref:Transcription factor domain-containing protein n=1 Tax=Clonostachys byssicola TaxID=160290 RepID=A0A9N9UHC8_9HYPO|nr:unnamed protein product [Clonostachys byssicola]